MSYGNVSFGRVQRAIAVGPLHIWVPGKERTSDSGGETRAIDFGELPDTPGRPGRALDATTRRKPNQVPQNVRKTRSAV